MDEWRREIRERLSSNCVRARGKLTARQGEGERSVPHGLRSIGHCCLDESVLIHLRRQCMWKTWVHSPQTAWRGR